MTKEVLLGDDEYRTLRVESREALRRLGIVSNPGFTNRDIVEGLARTLGRDDTFSDDMEQSEYSGELFRDSLGEILGLEIPPITGDVIAGLRELHLKS